MSPFLCFAYFFSSPTWLPTPPPLAPAIRFPFRVRPPSLPQCLSFPCGAASSPDVSALRTPPRPPREQRCGHVLSPSRFYNPPMIAPKFPGLLPRIFLPPDLSPGTSFGTYPLLKQCPQFPGLPSPPTILNFFSIAYLSQKRHAKDARSCHPCLRRL